MRNLKEIIKAVVFDIDGTILPNGTTKFSSKTKEMFKILKKNNILTIIASAREFATINDFLEQLVFVDYFVGANGAFVYEVNTKKILYEKTLKKSEIKDIYEEFGKETLGFSVVDYDKVFKNKNLNMNTWFIKPNMHNYYDIDFDKMSENHLSVATLVTDKPRVLTEKINNHIIKNNYAMSINAVWNGGLFIGPINVNKSIAIQWLLEHKGLSMHDLLAFGDSSNDFEMVRDAFFGIAMEKASWSLKSVAQDIAVDCEYDGTYLKLKELKII